MEAAAVLQRAIHCPERGKFKDPTKSSNPGTAIWKPGLRAPARVNQTGSHTDMKAGGCPSERSAFIRHINLPVSSSNPGWPLLCQPNGLRLPTVWGAMSQAIVGYDQPVKTNVGHWVTAQHWRVL